MLLGWSAGVVAMAGLVLAYGQRTSDNPAVAVVTLAVATVLALSSAVAGVIAARRPVGLRWPEGIGGRWPGWPWWWVLAGVGVLDLLAGPLVSGLLGVVGVVLVAVALVGLGRDLATGPPEVDRALVRAAQRLRAASEGVARNGGPGNGPDGGAGEAATGDDAAGTRAAVSYVGTLGARVTVFDASGRLADVVVLDAGRGEVAAAMAGLSVVPPGDLHPPLRTGQRTA